MLSTINIVIAITASQGIRAKKMTMMSLAWKVLKDLDSIRVGTD